MKNDDIDKLFSSLEDFSKNPPDDLWKGIEEQLDAPKKKKGFVYWWPVAASLLIGLGLLTTFYFQSNESDTLKNVPVIPENGVVNRSGSMDAETVNNTIEQQEIIQQKKGSIISKAKVLNNKGDEIETKVAVSKIVKHSKKNGNLVIQKESVNSKSKENNVVFNAVNDNTKPSGIKENEVEKEKEQLTDIKKDDLQDNALAEIVKEQQNREKKTSLEERWSVQVFAGVNNSQNIKNQKALGNTIESQKGYNYGVKTNYKLNKRWAVSSGLKVSELGQKVANVSYVNASKSLVNIAKGPMADMPSKGNITNNSNYLFIGNESNKDKNTFSSTFYDLGNLSQKVQYLEMPMEVSYAILNRGKAQLYLNTGGFVGKVITNQVLLNGATIGENANVNDVVFGTILSSTLQYELYKKTKIFVEPGMNYYNQPVKNQNFNQFQVMFNFGLNVSF